MKPELTVLTTSRDECRKSVVETLEAALAEANDGRIVAVAVAVVRPDGAINTSRSECDDVGRLLGAMALCQSRMCRTIDE